MRDVARWRSEFPVLQHSTYMISNSLGAMPRGAAEGLREYAETWGTRGVRAWEERWWEMAREVGDAIATIIGARPGTVSMHENVTTAQMVALSTLKPATPGDAIVCLEMDFPSSLYLFKAQQATGYTMRVVPAEPGFRVDVQRVVEAIDSRTVLVALSHVLFLSAYVVDVAPIVEKAHKVGAPVVLDTYQSAGILPVDVSSLGVDFAVGGCLKWLCGGPGNAFLYTNPQRLNTTAPRFTGWLAHRNPFDFDPDHLELREDAMRMMNGTPCIPAYYAALPGVNICGEVGIDRIRAHSEALTRRILDLVDELGFSSITPRDGKLRGGTVSVNVPDAKYVARTLKVRKFMVDYRPGAGIRVSPHFYNTVEEAEAVMVEMARIVRMQDYDLTEPFTSLVT
jgi:kynureninase